MKLSSLCLMALVLLAPGCDRPTKDDAEPAKEEAESKDATPESTPATEEPAATKTATPTAKPEPLSLDRTSPRLTTIDDAARARAEELVERYDGSFSFEVANRHNALALLHIAHSETDVELVADALEAIGRAYGREQDDDQRAFDADYFAVVRYRLSSEHPAIEEGAFDAARKGMEARPADPALLALLVDRAYYHPKLAGRLLALEALSPMRTPTPAVEGAFHHALGDSSMPLVALTLKRLSFKIGKRLPDQARLERRLLELMAHDDPGIRGRAAMALAKRTPRDDAERTRVSGLLAPMSRDPHAFVRLCSLEARAYVKDPAVVPELIALLDDRSETMFRAEGWLELDGSESRARLVSVGMRGTVREAAVGFLERATRGEPHAFDPTPVDTAHIEASTDRRVQDAKEWAARNAALLKAG